MAKQEDVKNAVAKSKVVSIPDLIEQQMPKMLRVSPRHIDGVRFTAMTVSLIKRNPELYKCDPYTILGSVFQCLELGLEPIEGQAYILPFRNKGKLEAQFIVGYKGLVQLFYRHESSLSLEWGVVYEKDQFDYEKGTAQFLRHKKAEGEKGEIKGYYVIAKLANGGMIFDYMSEKDCMDHGKKFSKTWNSEKGEFSHYSPWHTSPQSMCLKTVLRGVMKLLPKSVEIQKVLESDERIVSYNPINPPKSLLDLPDRTDWSDDEKEVIDVTSDIKNTNSNGVPVKDNPKVEETPEPGEDNASNGEFKPSSSDLKNTTEEQLRKEIGIMIMDIAKNDNATAINLLKSFTAFGDFAGYSSISEIKATTKTGKRTQLEVTHSKIKKSYLDRKEKVEEIDVDQEG